MQQIGRTKKNLHFNNNIHIPNYNDPTPNKRPLVDTLQKKFNNLPNEQMLCVDEQIVPFKGKSSLRQINPKKPHKWGYKISVLCNTKGLVQNFEIHTGNIQPS